MQPSAPCHSQVWVSDPGGLSCAFCPLTSGRSETHPYLCCQVRSAGPGQQHNDAGPCHRAIAKASHSYQSHSHTQSHMLYNYSVDLAAFSWTTVGYTASFQTQTGIYTQTCIYTQTHMHKHTYPHTPMHACTYEHANGQKGNSKKGCHR